jgi:phosphoribosylanthranilate isomerase
VRVKICGLRSRAEVAAAVEAGASYIGMVFFPRSPRHLTLGDARWVAEGAPEGLIRVALVVDADDDALETILSEVPVDMLQFHGRESPERVAAVRQRFGRPVMKAVGLADEADLPAIAEHARAADQILLDARPPRDAERPGGMGIAFDWRLIRGRRWPVPWMLAGGLTPENVGEAVRLTGATQGFKDPVRVAAFVRAAMAAEPLEA